MRRGLYEKRPLPLWVVRVAEVNPPKGVKPLEWILLTNRPVQTMEVLSGSRPACAMRAANITFIPS